jgi:3-oxoacyl-[acyl-carrier-protein] synthase-1
MVTAHTSVSALGADHDEVLSALAQGVTALGPGPALPFETRCGAVKTTLSPLPAELARYDTRIARLVAHLVADLEADIARARNTWGPARVGVFLGTSTAGILETEAAWRALAAPGGELPSGYEFSTQHAYDGMLVVARALTGLRGPGHVVSTACTSGAKVLGAAARLIALGAIDAALVGGVDTLCDLTLHGFHALGALSARACRPFSSERDGISIGEGGALMLLERRGEARARLIAVGESSDAHHISAPHPDGIGARTAMASALAMAGVSAAEVGHVNAHGTGTVLNDQAEARAIEAVLGRDVPVVSTKGYCGHTLGAAGAIEAVLTALALEVGWIPASVGAGPLDASLPIHVAQSRLTVKARYALSNSLAFGGNNTSVLLGAP